MPPGAFLRSPVSGVDALTRELRADSLVTSRYSRLLRLSPEMVRATFAHLRLIRLKQDMLLEVHHVHAHETIGSKVRRVRKGTPVFALPDGTPLLAQVCGNPLRGGDARVQLALHPNSADGPLTLNSLPVPRDIPDFDPAEPQNTPALPPVSRTITLRDAVPLMQVRPERENPILSQDEVPAEALEKMPSIHTVAQAGESLSGWVGGGTLIGTAVALTGHNPGPVLSEILPLLRRPDISTTPGQIPRTPPDITVTPEPDALLLAVALAAALLVHFNLRRRKTRSRNSRAV